MNPSSSEILNNIGLCYFNSGDYDKAIEYFSSAIRENYEFPRALNNLGNALRKKN
jgi:pentatricopeptide repeat protein